MIRILYSPEYDLQICSLMGVPVRDTLLKDTARFSLLWKKYGAKIVAAFEKYSGLTFSYDVSCYLVSHFPDLAISRPLTLRYTSDSRRLLYVLIHELAHELLSQNKERVGVFVETMFSTMDLEFRHHVPVLLLQQKVVTAVFGKKFFLLQQKKDFALPLGLVWHTVEEIIPHYRATLMEFLEHDGLAY